MRRILFAGDPFPPRRLLLVTVYYILGILAGDVCSFGVCLLLALIPLAAGARVRSSFVCLLALCFAAGSGIYTLHRLLPPDHIANITSPVTAVSGTVVSVPEFSCYEGQLMRVTSAETPAGPVPARGCVLLYAKRSLPYGACLTVRDAPRFITGEAAFGMDAGRYYARKNVYMSVFSRPGNTLLTGMSSSLLMRAADMTRHAVIRSARLLPKEAGGFLTGMLMGSRDYISDELYRACIGCGIIHLLAASGFHCGLVALAVGLCLGPIPDHRVKSLCVILCLWFYVLLTGCAPGAVRGALCVTLFLAGSLLGRGCTKPSYTLLLSALVILCVSPSQLFDVGFRLSYVCAAALLVIAPYLSMPVRSARRRGRLGAGAAHAGLLLAASAAVALAVLPFQIYYFNYVSLAGFLLGIPLCAVITCYFYMGVIAMLCSAIPLTGQAAAWVAGPAGDFTVWLIRQAGDASRLWTVGVLPPAAVIVWYLCAALVILLLWRRFGERRSEDV
ncbi:MAG: ComEC/Rec2 family competence protein [Abditibacteriota bacterium]|nr:ComEC/Rec2 family competence protein [Abditibacteriota bacterium]